MYLLTFQPLRDIGLKLSVLYVCGERKLSDQFVVFKMQHIVKRNIWCKSLRSDRPFLKVLVSSGHIFSAAVDHDNLQVGQEKLGIKVASTVPSAQTSPPQVLQTDNLCPPYWEERISCTFIKKKKKSFSIHQWNKTKLVWYLFPCTMLLVATSFCHYIARICFLFIKAS